MTQRAKDVWGYWGKRAGQIMAVLMLATLVGGTGIGVGQNIGRAEAPKPEVTKERVDALEKRIDSDKDFQIESLKIGRATYKAVTDLAKGLGRMEGRLDEHVRQK